MAKQTRAGIEYVWKWGSLIMLRLLLRLELNRQFR